MKQLLVFSIIILGLSSCFWNERIRGNGVMARQERSISDFSVLSVSGPIDVVVKQDVSASMRIEGDENLLSYITVHNDGHRLKISTKEGFNLVPEKGLRVYVSGPSFENISLTGSGDLSSAGKIKSDKIDVDITGSGDATLEVDAPVITADVTGSGSVKLKGETRSFETHINGSGEIYAYDLLSENTKIKISGSGDAELYASKQLNIIIAGSGDVSYKGNPSVKQSIAGSGDIRRVE